MPPVVTHALQNFLPAPWLQILLAVVSAVCGGIVGAEREKHEKPAGLRTLVLVCLGSAAFTMVSYTFSTTTGDSGRVAAQIVTGIGFLGAGAILHGPGLITGMTTAATIWVTAAIGMVVGSGFAIPGIALSLFVRLLLTTLNRWETRHLRHYPTSTVQLLIDPAHGKTRIRLEKILGDHRVPKPDFAPEDAEGRVPVTMQFFLPAQQKRDLLFALTTIPEVIEIRE